MSDGVTARLTVTAAMRPSRRAAGAWLRLAPALLLLLLSVGFGASAANAFAGCDCGAAQLAEPAAAGPDELPLGANERTKPNGALARYAAGRAAIEPTRRKTFKALEQFPDRPLAVLAAAERSLSAVPDRHRRPSARPLPPSRPCRPFLAQAPPLPSGS